LAITNHQGIYLARGVVIVKLRRKLRKRGRTIETLKLIHTISKLHYLIYKL